jgi:hypothetical protein
MRRLLASLAVAFTAVLLPVFSVSAHASTVRSTHHTERLTLPALGLHRLLGAHTLHATQSSNWAGYVDTEHTFSKATGSWVQPSVTCGNDSFLGLFSEASYSAYWVGLDGNTSSTVEQIGTDSDCLSSGTPSYYAWYELYPSGAVDLSTSTNPVAPGDTLTATVNSSSATQFTLTLVDTSKTHAGWTYTSGFSVANGADRSSAEWVAEAPSTCELLFCSVNNLADFGSVTFSGAQATPVGAAPGPITSFDDQSVTMSNGSETEASPGPITNSGNPQTSSFKITTGS